MEPGYNAPAAALYAVFPPLTALLAGPWLLAGVVAGLLVRRPGAALLAEVVAAAVSALIGSQWGWTVLLSGALQGLGVEIALALFAWRRFGPFVAVLAGLARRRVRGRLLRVVAVRRRLLVGLKLAYLGAVVSGAVVAGLGGLLLVRALAKTGAANAMPPGQEELERSAV